MEDLNKKLKIWFVIHFVVDVFNAMVLFVFPGFFSQLAGLDNVHPLYLRAIASALMAIGIESFFSRSADKKVLISWLRFKIIWSSGLIISTLISLMASHKMPSVVVLMILLIVVIFNMMWWLFYRELKEDK